MKRVIAFILILSTVLSFSACQAELVSTEEETQTVAESVTKATAESEGGEIVIPKGFSVGYGTADISGSPDKIRISYYGGLADGVHDPLLLTCIAVSDGEEVALIMTADLKKMFEPTANRSLSIIERDFGIPASNVILSCTHTHSAPDAGADGTGNAQWLQQYYKKIPQAVEAALRDLDTVKGAYSGKAIQEGIGFVRRYLLADGTYKFNPSRADNPIAHESEADPEMRTIRFDRENKKDILLVNFQTHYYGTSSKYPQKFSADFVDPFRRSAEKEFDCLFAYYSGASGNINQIAMLSTDKKAPNADAAFMEGARKCLKAEEKVEVGKLCIERSLYEATCMVRTPEKIAQAQEITNLGTNTAAGKALMKQYGFVDANEVSFTLYYKALTPTQQVPFNVIAFGDFAFVSASYEMFDTNGIQVREASPYKNTFLCTLAHAANGYVPSALGYEHGSYETFNCRFVAGSGELFAQEMIRLLNLCKNK